MAARKPLAYSYIRFSLERQQFGDSKRRQTKMAEKWVEENDCKLDTTLNLEDLGISAFRGDNAECGALAAFIEAVEKGKVAKGSFLLIESLDRLSRNQIGEALELFLGLLKREIKIVTLDTGDTFDRESINNPIQLIVAIVVLSRAHEESATKSRRVKEAWDEKKRLAREEKKPMSSMIPGWLELIDGEFQIIGHKAAIVREIFKMTIDGIGKHTISRLLNKDKEKYPPFKHGTSWHSSYIHKIIHNRAVLGEYQPHTGKAKNRTSVGEPIPNYYPAIIDETTFYRAQKATQQRMKQRGPVGKKVNNLFTGIVFDARSKTSMVFSNKNGKDTSKTSPAVLAPSGAIRGEAEYWSVRYDPLERVILEWVANLDPRNFVDSTPNALHELEAKETRLADVRGRIAILQEQLKSGDIRAVLPVIASLENEENELVVEIEKRNAEVHETPQADAIGEAKQLYQLLNDANEDDSYRIRRKLQQELKRVIDQIWILPFWSDGQRYELIQVFRIDGKQFEMLLMRNVTHRGTELERAIVVDSVVEPLDLRDYNDWPEHRRHEQTEMEISDWLVECAARCYTNGNSTVNRLRLFKDATGRGKNVYYNCLRSAKERKLVEPLIRS